MPLSTTLRTCSESFLTGIQLSSPSSSKIATHQPQLQWRWQKALSMEVAMREKGVVWILEVLAGERVAKRQWNSEDEMMGVDDDAANDKVVSAVSVQAQLQDNRRPLQYGFLIQSLYQHCQEGDNQTHVWVVRLIFNRAVESDKHLSFMQLHSHYWEINIKSTLVFSPMPRAP